MNHIVSLFLVENSLHSDTTSAWASTSPSGRTFSTCPRACFYETVARRSFRFKNAAQRPDERQMPCSGFRSRSPLAVSWCRCWCGRLRTDDVTITTVTQATSTSTCSPEEMTTAGWSAWSPAPLQRQVGGPRAGLTCSPCSVESSDPLSPRRDGAGVLITAVF